jgi:hypothetical protein
LNLLPLSNVRLEIDEPKSKNSSSLNQGSKSYSTALSVLSDKSNGDNEKHSIYKGRISITKIEDIVLSKLDSDENKVANLEDSNVFEISSKEPIIEKGITSFHAIAKEKRQFETTSHTRDNTLNESNYRQLKPTVESYYSKAKQTFLDKVNKCSHENNKTVGLHSEENQSINEDLQIEEIEDSKSEINESEEMSRRPQVLTIIDNDITKPKKLIKSVAADITFADNDATCKENIFENNSTSQQTFKALSKQDIINDHIQKKNIIMNDADINSHSERLSVENARNFFEKKSADKELVTNHTDARVNRTMKESSSIIDKTCNAAKGSLGYETRSESSDLGLGSETGSDVRRLSVDDSTNTINDNVSHSKASNECSSQVINLNHKNQKNYSNLTRSRSCIDSIECQVSDEPEFDHVRYKIVKSNVFNKNVINNSRKDVAYDGIMQYLREYSIQDLLMDNNVVIIEPVRAEVERKSSFNETKFKTSTPNKSSPGSVQSIKNTESSKPDKEMEGEVKNHFIKTPRQSSLRKHFFYQPIRVNRELNDDELPDPDTVRNVRKMFEETMKKKLKMGQEIARDYSTKKSISMKDLRTIESRLYETGSEKAAESSRYLC